MAEGERIAIEPDWIWTDTPEVVAWDWIGDPFRPLVTLTV
jgi:hypothetical protein